MTVKKAGRARLESTPAPHAATPRPAGRAAMVRTQIYLTRSEHEYLQTEAKRHEVSMAEILRVMVRERMEVPEDVWLNNPLLQPPADPAFRGPKDGVVNHDHYVYGGPKKWVKRKGRWVEAPPLPRDYFENAKSAAAYDRKLSATK